MKELISIQSTLKSPKDKRNDFGKYNYRTAEGILEAVKPLLFENGCFIYLSDSLIEIGGEVYIQATATIQNRNGDKISVTAYAREEENKKGMSAEQMTGSASSYARKYALNGLLAIDSSELDPDSRNNTVIEELSKELLNEIGKANDLTTLRKIWNKYSQFQRNQSFKNEVNKRKGELNDGNIKMKNYD